MNAIKESIADREKKETLIQAISQLYLHNHFELNENDYANKVSFYTVALQVLNDFDFDKSKQQHMISYIAGNFGDSSINNKFDLIIHLNKQLCGTDPVSYRSLGFRSIWWLLDNNKDNLTLDYVSEIVRLLLPFFDGFKCKEYLEDYIYLLAEIKEQNL